MFFLLLLLRGWKWRALWNIDDENEDNDDRYHEKLKSARTEIGCIRHKRIKFLYALQQKWIWIRQMCWIRKWNQDTTKEAWKDMTHTEEKNDYDELKERGRGKESTKKCITSWSVKAENSKPKKCFGQKHWRKRRKRRKNWNKNTIISSENGPWKAFKQTGEGKKKLCWIIQPEYKSNRIKR